MVGAYFAKVTTRTSRRSKCSLDSKRIANIRVIIVCSIEDRRCDLEGLIVQLYIVLHKLRLEVGLDLERLTLVLEEFWCIVDRRFIGLLDLGSANVQFRLIRAIEACIFLVCLERRHRERRTFVCLLVLGEVMRGVCRLEFLYAHGELR